MVIEKSALKHGIPQRDIAFVFGHPVNSIILRQQERMFTMLFGYDTIGRILEVGYIMDDQGEEHIIHAMKIRQSYRVYLPGRRGGNDGGE